MTPAPTDQAAAKAAWYAAAEQLLPAGATLDTWIDATWECLRLAGQTPAQAVAWATGPRGRWNAARKALKQALADGTTGPQLEAYRTADKEAWYTAVDAHLPAGTTPDAWGAPDTWETLRWPRDMAPADAVRHQTSPTRRGYRVEAEGLRPASAASLRGAEASLGRKLTTKGQVGRIFHNGRLVAVGIGTGLGWVSMVPTYADILATYGRDTVDTGAGTPLQVNLREYGHVDQQDIIDRVAVPHTVTLTQDGRGYDRDTRHTGPPTGPLVYVERWTPQGRQFHGWIDPTTRQLVQAG